MRPSNYLVNSAKSDSMLETIDLVSMLQSVLENDDLVSMADDLADIEASVCLAANKDLLDPRLKFWIIDLVGALFKIREIYMVNPGDAGTEKINKARNLIINYIAFLNGSVQLVSLIPDLVYIAS